MATLIKHSERTNRKPCRGCGSSDLYWAHDLNQPNGHVCDKCTSRLGETVNGKWVLMTRHGTAHVCVDKDRSDAQHPEHEDEHEDAPSASPAPAPSPVAAMTAPQSGDQLEALKGLLAMLAPSVKPEDVKAMVRAEYGSYAETLESRISARLAEVSMPLTVKLEANGEVKPLAGTVHKVTPTVIKLAGNARKHVMMVGPAGTGKSTIAEKVAEALGLPYYGISCSPQMQASALIGYMQAEGKYVRTLFREAYENGGVFHFDEIDNSHPSVLALINAALSNGHMAFADGMIKRHPDFRCLASANTYGRGADRMYVGRQPIDAATADRFFVVDVDVDESLERAMCEATGASPRQTERVLAYVRRLRRNAVQHKMPVIFSPRASEGMCLAMAIGIPEDDAVAMRLRRGLSDADWQKVTGGSKF